MACQSIRLSCRLTALYLPDASRAANIRNLARRNWRWKAFLLWDRLQGWVVVTSIGVLTALVAFAIVRGALARRFTSCPGQV
jgi:hypothetical protein